MNKRTATIEDRIKTVINETLRFNINVADLSRTTPLIGKGLGLDSIGLQELVVSLEKEFDIMIEDDELTMELFENIGNLADYIGRKLAVE